MENVKYFQFPLLMIRNISENPEKGEQDILAFALVDFALKQKITDADAARQAFYGYYRGDCFNELKCLIDKYASVGQIVIDEDYSGFDGNIFQPDIEQLSPLMEKDSKLKRIALLNAQLSTINDFFQVSGPAPDERMEKYNRIKSVIDQHEAKYGKEPRPTIARDLFFDLIKEPELFAGYIAIRSLEGQKKFTGTNRPTIAGRMAGFKSAKLLPEKNQIFRKYSKRYHFDQLLNQLMDRNLLKSILRQKNWSHIYLSTKLSPAQLGRAVGEQLSKNKLKRNNDEAKKALQQVYNGASI